MNYDLVIENGRVIDLETNTDEILSVGIKDGVIVILTKENLTGETIIDATGCIVSPGFIDIHAHEDFLQDSENKQTVPVITATVLLHSGVTTMIGGNCGIGAYPFQPYLDKLEEHPLPLSYYTLIGYSSLREWLGIGNYDHPSEKDISQLVNMVEEGMKLGLPGVSFGLQYTPGTTFEEMLAVARIVKEYGGFIASHMRYDYPLKAQETFQEMLEIVKATGVSAQLSHLSANIYGGNNMKNVLQTIKQMNENGYDVTADMYPFDAWSTGIKTAVFDNDPFKNYGFTYEDMEIVTGPYAGERCSRELFCQLRELDYDTFVACHNATPWQDIVEALKSPYVFLGSDGIMTRNPQTGEINGHPRCAGTTAKFLRVFVKDNKWLALKNAIGKMTLDPALRLRLSQKGRIQPGMDADITIFQLERLLEKGEYGINVCALPPEGIEYVIVEGKISYTAEEGIAFTKWIRRLM